MSSFPNYTNITELGRVVVNAKRDVNELRRRDSVKPNSNKQNVLYNSNTTEECYTVQQGELCFSNKGTNRTNRMINDTDINVFSNFNRAFVNVNGNNSQSDDNDKRSQKRRKLNFIGVAENVSTHSSSRNPNDTDVVVQVGGLRTIANTGSETFNVGDKIIWDLPSPDEHSTRPKIPGIPHDKVLPVLRKVTHGMNLTSDEIQKELNIDNVKNMNVNDTYDNASEFSKKLSDVILSAAAMGAYIYSREINLEGNTDMVQIFKDFGLFKKNGHPSHVIKNMNDNDWSKNACMDKAVLKAVLSDKFVMKRTEEEGNDMKHIRNFYKNKSSELIKECYNKIEDVKSRIIGKAVSNARPGKPFDILLGGHTT